MEKRIKTTMIGAIDIFQQKFALLIETDQEFKRIFFEARKEILDLGNNQIRLLKKEEKGL